MAEDKSLKDILGMTFEADGKWSAKDVGDTKTFRKLNRKQRRAQKKLDKKRKKI